VVKAYLAHGPITVEEVQHKSVLHLYVQESKTVRSSSADMDKLGLHVSSWRTQTEYMLLNAPLAHVCDSVHYALTDLSLKFLKPDLEVCKPELMCERVCVCGCTPPHAT
jgi:hypothetical protein